ncbi:MAG: ABC transporter permease [Chitinophagales bacterium]|nr:ABC transporter permease [Chitinophagales bacterium]
MFKYIIKRIFIFLPTIFIISLLTFMLSVSVPGDPVEQMLSSNTESGSVQNALASEQAYIKKRQELGLDLPVFYFSISNEATPKDLHLIPKKFHRNNLSRLIAQYGNWTLIDKYYQSIKQLEFATLETKRDSANGDAIIAIKDNIYQLYINDNNNVIQSSISKIQNQTKKDSSLLAINKALLTVKNNYQELRDNPTPIKYKTPTIHWYGTQCQYHQWITKFMKGDFGISYKDGRPVKSVLLDAVRWTVILSIISIILTYLISIPLGVVSAAKKGSKTDQTISTILFLLYSLPSFWVATLLIMFFGGGDFLNWFPAYGVGQIESGMSFMEKFGIRAYHLVLPLICYTYGSLAYISRQMRGAMVDTLSQDYIRTARAKGLNQRTILWKHAFKNSLLPIITLFASVFPLAVSGAIVLEIIFSIPGMGKLAYDALVARNYPIVYSVVMFSAILTLVGFLVADILYALVDPRISYNKK